MSAVDTRAAFWPGRSADVRTAPGAGEPTPPNLDDPAQVRACATAYAMGYETGAELAQKDAYVGGWRFGVICGALAGAIVCCCAMKLGYLVGLVQ